MPIILESLGMEDAYDEKDFTENWMKHAMSTGREFPGYRGGYIHTPYSSAEWYSHYNMTEKGYEVDGFNLQVSGGAVWKVYYSDLELSNDTSNRVAFVKSCNNGGFTMMNIINPEVLPCYLEDVEINLQVVANAISVTYYENEEDLAESIEPLEDTKLEEFKGKKFIPAIGSILANGFMHGHMIKEGEEFKEDKSHDELVLITGIVKRFITKEVSLEEDIFGKFIVAVIDTQYGELEIVHSGRMVKESDRTLLKAGSVIQAVAVLSGDPAINEYENGIIKDFEHDLAALRHSLVKGEAERLESIMVDNAKYESVNIDEPIVGKEDIIKRMNYVADVATIKYFSYLATLHNEYEGERCIVLAEDEEDNLTAVVRIKVNSDGLITNIVLSDDSALEFTIDEPPIFDEYWSFGEIKE